MSVRGFESLSLRRVEAWQSGDCSGLEHRRPLGARRFESYSLRPWKVGRSGDCTVLLKLPRLKHVGFCRWRNGHGTGQSGPVEKRAGAVVIALQR